MAAPETAERSAKALTLAANASFVPIGIATVFLGPMLPVLSARWSWSYSQAGALFPVQYVAATAAVALSGVVASRYGYRFAIKAGLLSTAFGMALLLTGSKVLGILCVAAYGAGQGLAVPPGNLLVAEVNPRRRSGALNLLNFCWSTGAVACPFLVAAAAKNQRIPLLLAAIAGVSLLVAAGIAAMPSSIVEPAVSGNRGEKAPKINWKQRALPTVAALFFMYVGTENGFGLWIASYAKSLGSLTAATALLTPSFFYASLMLGRWVAPVLLRTIDEIRLAQSGLVVACAGMVGLVLSRGLAGVAVSGSLAGLGLSSVYPITISLLAREFGTDGSRLGSLMFTLSNLGGGSLPWLVGVASSRFATLKAGLAVPLIGSIVMFLLYMRDWSHVHSDPAAQSAEEFGSAAN
jgi:MFS transporter, FHS family, glucose/mannose:H+ symporter